MACWCFGAPKALEEDNITQDDYGNVPQTAHGNNRKGNSVTSPGGSGAHDFGNKGAAADERVAMSSLAVLHAAQIRNIRSDNAGTTAQGHMGKGPYGPEMDALKPGQRIPDHAAPLGFQSRTGWQSEASHSRPPGYDIHRPIAEDARTGDPGSSAGQHFGDPMGRGKTPQAFASKLGISESGTTGDTTSHSLMGVSFERTCYLDAAPGRPRIMAWMEDANMTFAVINEFTNETVQVADSPLLRGPAGCGEVESSVASASVKGKVTYEGMFRSSLKDGSYLDLCSTTPAPPPSSSRGQAAAPISLTSITQQRRGPRRDYSPARAVLIPPQAPSNAWKGESAGDSTRVNDSISKMSQQGSAPEASAGTGGRDTGALSRLAVERRADVEASDGASAALKAGRSKEGGERDSRVRTKAIRGDFASDPEDGGATGRTGRRGSADVTDGESSAPEAVASASAAAATAAASGGAAAGARGIITGKALDDSAVHPANGRAAEGSFPPSPMRDKSWYAVSPTPGSPAMALALIGRSPLNDGQYDGAGRQREKGGGRGAGGVPGREELKGDVANAGAGADGSSHEGNRDLTSTESSG